MIAADRPEAALLDVRTNTITTRVALPGRAQAVATTTDGSRAYVAAGRGITAIDLATRAAAGRATLTAHPTTVATSPDGARVYATHKPSARRHRRRDHDARSPRSASRAPPARSRSRPTARAPS